MSAYNLLMKSFYRCFTGPDAARDGFLEKGVGDPSLFTVSQMSYFRGFISKVCRNNKVSQGICKKNHWHWRLENETNFMVYLGGTK